MNRERVILVVATVVIMALFAYGGHLIWNAESSKQDCLDHHEVCVETTDGWKPYYPEEAP